MSILLGHFEHGQSELPSDLLTGRARIAQQYADGEGLGVIRDGVAMRVLPYASHARDGMRLGLVEGAAGEILSFDGRLDNFEELAGLCGVQASQVSDADLALAVYTRFGEESFARLTGDWALCLWSRRQRRLLLARDHAGTRTLYYAMRSGGMAWSSLLDDLVTDIGELSEAYATRYLSCRYTEHFTPYNHVFAVRPGHAVVVEGETLREVRHWSPLVSGSIAYAKDREYQDHLRWLFERAVTRRTGEGAPILAQLSGGMDSSSIVCMSDYIRRRGTPGAELLDTISFFDDSERTLDDKRYFTAVEASRGKRGIHLDTAFAHRTFEPVSPERGRYLLPGGDSCSYERERALQALIAGRGYRSVLSGIGGDEVLGGVPTPFAELGDLLANASLATFVRRAYDWSLPTRTPLIRTVAEAVKFSRGVRKRDRADIKPVPNWLSPQLRDAFVATPLPFALDRHASVSRLGNAWAWCAILETLPHAFPNILTRFEYRYPFLDKDLVEFLFRIPREQILRPGRNRDLMKRTLGPLLPEQVLHRKSKGFVQRAPMVVFQRSCAELTKLLSRGCLAASGFVDVDLLVQAMDSVARGQRPELMQPLLRAVGLELWLRTLPSASDSAADSGCTHPTPTLTSSVPSRSTNSQETTRTPVIA